MWVSRIPALSWCVCTKGAIPIGYIGNDAKRSSNALLSVIVGIVHGKPIATARKRADIELGAILGIDCLSEHVMDSDMMVPGFPIDPSVHVGAELLDEALNGLFKALDEKFVSSCDGLLAIKSVRCSETVD